MSGGLSVWDFRAAEKKKLSDNQFNPTSWSIYLPFMAKNKGKRSSGANETVPDGGVPVNDSNTGAEAFPQIQEGAFAGLRQKIEQKLKDENAAKQKKVNNANNKSKPTPKEAPKQNNKQAAPAQAAKRGSDADKNNQGKKRDRNGDVIARGGKKEAEKPKPTKSNESDENEALRQEILALGGTEEDFDLIADLESDSEVEGAKEAPKKSNNKSDDDLRKELSSMLAAAGQVVPDDLPDDEVEDEAEAEDEDAGEEDEEMGDNELDVGEDEEAQSDLDEGSDGNISSDQEDSSPPAKKETKKQKANQDPVHNTVPREYAKLVSIHGNSYGPYANISNRPSPHDPIGTTPSFPRYLRNKSMHCPGI